MLSLTGPRALCECTDAMLAFAARNHSLRCIAHSCRCEPAKLFGRDTLPVPTGPCGFSSIHSQAPMACEYLGCFAVLPV